MLAGFFVFHVSGRETHVMNFTDNSYAKLTKFSSLNPIFLATDHHETVFPC